MFKRFSAINWRAYVSSISMAVLIGCSTPEGAEDLEIEVQSQALIDLPRTQQATAVTDCVFDTGIEGPSVSQRGALYVPNLERQGTLGRLNTRDSDDTFSVVNESIGVTPNGSRIIRGKLYIVDKGQTVDGVHSDMGLRIYDLRAPDADPIVLNFLTGEGLKDFSVSDRTWEINDLDIAPNGDLYVSAPCWAGDACPDGDQGRVYRLNTKDIEKNARRTGAAIETVLNDLLLPNGIAVGPLGFYLHVSTGGGADWSNGWPAPINPLRVLRFPIHFDRSLGAEEALIHLKADEFIFLWSQDLDGLRADMVGNLYVANWGAGEVHYINAWTGEVLSTITVDQPNVTNIAFGGKRRKTLYITSHDGTCGIVSAIDVPIPGRNYRFVRRR